MVTKNKIQVGNIAFSKEGWEWWINVWEKEKVPFTSWFKRVKAITNIKKHIEPTGVEVTDIK